MLLISQNLAKYNMPFPEETVYRINLAWVNGVEELISLLNKHAKHDIFLDLPIGRTKPPKNNFSIDELIPIINSYKKIRYLAISNVESPSDISTYMDKLPDNVTIVPKIETVNGIKNIKEITSLLPSKKILMLDHDDLYSSIIKLEKSTSEFKEYIDKLIEFCKENNVELLRTRGVIFSDQ